MVRNSSMKISQNIKKMNILDLSRSTNELTHDANRVRNNKARNTNIDKAPNNTMIVSEIVKRLTIN